MPLAPHLRTGADRRARVDDLPGHHRGAGGPDPRRRLGPAGRHATSTSATAPSASTPATRTGTLENTPKVVSGIDAASLAAVQGFYDRIVERTVPVSTPKEAELTKLLENTFRHVNIALVNELAMFANDLGIDVWEAIDAASTKPFGYMRFTPGPGVGGHCLPIDPSYLSWRVRQSLGQAFRFVELANDVNDHMPDYVVRRLVVRPEPAGPGGQGPAHPAARPVVQAQHRRRRVSRRRNRSPASSSQLGAEVLAADPFVDASHVPAGVEHVDLDAESLGSADAVIFLVDHDGFDAELVAEHATYVLDTRHVLPPATTSNTSEPSRPQPNLCGSWSPGLPKPAQERGESEGPDGDRHHGRERLDRKRAVGRAARRRRSAHCRWCDARSGRPRTPSSGIPPPAGIDAASLEGTRRCRAPRRRRHRRQTVDRRPTSGGPREPDRAPPDSSPRPWLRCSAHPACWSAARPSGTTATGGDEVLTEHSAPGDLFLSEVCVAWESAAQPAIDAGIRVAFTRTGIVLDAHGGALPKLLPLFKLGVGGRMGSGRQWWSWISIDDDIRALQWLLTHDVTGPVNLTAPNPVTNGDFSKVLGAGAPPTVGLPGAVVRPEAAARRGAGAGVAVRQPTRATRRARSRRVSSSPTRISKPPCGPCWTSRRRADRRIGPERGPGAGPPPLHQTK